MPRIYADLDSLAQLGDRCRSVSSVVSSICSDLQNTVSRLDWDIRYESDINSTANRIAEQLQAYSRNLKRYQSFLQEVQQKYNSLNSFRPEGFQLNTQNRTGALNEQSLWERFWSAYGWDGLLAGSGYIKKIYGFFKDFANGQSWSDYLKTGSEVVGFLLQAEKTFQNYWKIGNAVGRKTSMTWWLKAITGFKSLGRVSTAKSPLTRFVNNLKNKTSPFNMQFKEIGKNFTGANGAGKAFASWASVAVTGIGNWFSNKEEQKRSNGTMSDGRAVAETIGETVVDTALTYGGSILVGAAVAALAPVSLPGIAVTAISGAIVAGVNVGVEALTGKSATEWISDTVLDMGEAALTKVGNAISCVGDTVSSWFSRLSFA